MKRMETKQLSKILSDGVIHRDIIDESKPGRIIEKIESTSRGTVLIKYGNDSGVRDEVMIYQTMNRLFESNLIPLVHISEQFGEEMYFLALDWIDGIHPDFTSPGDISVVFTSLGKWAANWSKLTDMFGDEYVSPLNQHQYLYKLLEKNKPILNKTLGRKTLDLLHELVSKSDTIIRNLKKMPNTLDPGDISLHNIILKSADKDKETTLIDFESASIRPMVMIFEHFGEGYESIPYTDEGIALAMKSFFTEWNENSEAKIHWQDFKYSQICAMAYYKMGEYIYWIERILHGRKIEETMGWLNQDHKPLKNLMAKLEARDVV